jgi:hypothetical protein
MWWVQDPSRSAQWAQFEQEQGLLCHALLSRQYDTDSSDESMLTFESDSASSPALSIDELLEPCDEEYLTLNYTPPSRDNRPLPPTERYEGGREQGARHSGRQQRIQEHSPYSRPSQSSRRSNSDSEHYVRGANGQKTSPTNLSSIAWRN